MNEFQINNPADCMAYLLIFVSGSDGELSGHEGTATMKILTEFILYIECHEFTGTSGNVLYFDMPQYIKGRQIKSFGGTLTYTILYRGQGRQTSHTRWAPHTSHTSLTSHKSQHWLVSYPYFSA